jgi:hypothetical protein
MPIAYKIDSKLGIVFADWRGAVTANEIAEYWTELVADKEALACGRTIADISCCEMRFTGEELRSLAERILEPAIRGKNWKTAVIIKDPVHYGVTRQYEMYSEGFMNTNVFYSAVLAHKWVLS